jgi:hypothetical protein
MHEEFNKQMCIPYMNNIFAFFTKTIYSSFSWLEIQYYYIIFQYRWKSGIEVKTSAKMRMSHIDKNWLFKIHLIYGLEFCISGSLFLQVFRVFFPSELWIYEIILL